MTARPYVLLSVTMSVDGYIDDMRDARLMLSNDEDFDRVDEVRHRQRLVVELQAERPAGVRSLERPAHASRRDVVADPAS